MTHFPWWPIASLGEGTGLFLVYPRGGAELGTYFLAFRIVMEWVSECNSIDSIMLGDAGATVMTKIQLELLPWVLTSLLPRLSIKNQWKLVILDVIWCHLVRFLRRGIRGNKLEDETQVIWSFSGFSQISMSILVWNIISFSLKTLSSKSMNLEFKSGVLQNAKWLLSNLVLLLMTTQILWKWIDLKCDLQFDGTVYLIWVL